MPLSVLPVSHLANTWRTPRGHHSRRVTGHPWWCCHTQDRCACEECWRSQQQQNMPGRIATPSDGKRAQWWPGRIATPSDGKRAQWWPGRIATSSDGKRAQWWTQPKALVKCHSKSPPHPHDLCWGTLQKGHWAWDSQDAEWLSWGWRKPGPNHVAPRFLVTPADEPRVNRGDSGSQV